MSKKKEPTPEPAARAGPTAQVVKTGLTTQHIVLILGALVIVGATVVAAILLTREDAPPPAAPMLTNQPIVTEENVAQIEQDIGDRVERGMFETHMNTTWTFPDGKSASTDAVMGNSANNNFPFYFTVTLSDTREVVFTSGLLPLGSQIAEIVLEKELPAGTYDSVVHIHMIDDDGVPVENNMGVNVTLRVLN